MPQCSLCRNVSMCELAPQLSKIVSETHRLVATNADDACFAAADPLIVYIGELPSDCWAALASVKLQVLAAG